MASHQVTVEDDVLTSLLSRQDGLSRLVSQVLNQILSHQARDLVQAEPYERTGQRQGYRNGTRERSLQTRIGTLTLSVPRLRGGEFSTELFERYQRSEQGFVLALMERVIQGVWTRKVTAITEELCGAIFSKSTVSALCAQLDPIVEGWRNRPLTGRYRALRVIGDILPGYQMTDASQWPALHPILPSRFAERLLPARRARSNPRVIMRQQSKFPVKGPQHKGSQPLRKAFAETIGLMGMVLG